MFGCSPTAPDSIQHYASCVVGHSVTARELGLRRADSPADRLASFLGLDVGPSADDSEIVLRGIRLAAMYRVHCHCRHGALRRGPAATEALQQASWDRQGPPARMQRVRRGAGAVAATLSLRGPWCVPASFLLSVSRLLPMACEWLRVLAGRRKGPAAPTATSRRRTP